MTFLRSNNRIIFLHLQAPKRLLVYQRRMKKQVAQQDEELIRAERTTANEKRPSRGGGLGFNQQACG